MFVGREGPRRLPHTSDLASLAAFGSDPFPFATRRILLAPSCADDTLCSPTRGRAVYDHTWRPVAQKLTLAEIRALLSVGGAAALVDELIFSGSSLALVKLGLPAALWGSSMHALLIVLLAAGSASSVLLAVMEGIRPITLPME